MFSIRRVQPRDVEPALSAVGAAFADDPLMHYFFGDDPKGVPARTMEFFSILLRTRIELDMPAFVLEHEDGVHGLAMGYDTSRPARPAALAQEMSRFEADVPAFSARVAAYIEIADAHEPSEDHYYLGVLGVHPALQGQGAGRALLDAFCALSHADPKSHGVFLETSSARSLEFYLRNGFELRGEGRLGATPLWCVYRPT